MDDRHRSFVTAFAEQILSHDYTSAHGNLASWLRAEITPERLQAFVQTEIDTTAEYGEWEPRHPDAFTLDSNPGWKVNDLRTSTRFGERPSNETFPAQITEENFKIWLVAQFTSKDEEFDHIAWFDWWMALVEEDGELRIGYFEMHEAD